MHDRFIRRAIVENVINRIFEDVLHGKLDIDNVLVVRQHQGFFEDFVLLAAAIADLNRSDPRNIDDFVRLNRVGQAPTQAGFRTLLVFTESEHEPTLRGVYDVETTCQPHSNDNGEYQTDTTAEHSWTQINRRTIAAVTAALPARLLVEQRGQTAIQIPPQLFQVRRPLVWASSPAIVIAAVTPLRII